MQVAAHDFCVVFIRKKVMKTYKWIDPTNRNQRLCKYFAYMHSNYLWVSKTHSWTINEVYANDTHRMEDEYFRMRQVGEHGPVTVKFIDQVKEIYVSVQAVIIHFPPCYNQFKLSSHT